MHEEPSWNHHDQYTVQTRGDRMIFLFSMHVQRDKVETGKTYKLPQITCTYWPNLLSENCVGITNSANGGSTFIGCWSRANNEPQIDSILVSYIWIVWLVLYKFITLGQYWFTVWYFSGPTLVPHWPKPNIEPTLLPMSKTWLAQYCLSILGQ